MSIREGDTVTPHPGSDQARLCNAWGGALGWLFWVVPGLGVVTAVVVGVLWTRGRLHGAWVLVSVAGLVLSPILVSEALTWPSDTVDRPANSERTADGAGRG